MKKIRLAIIGCGGFVRYHCKGIQANCPEYQVVGLCDIIPERAVKLRDEYFVKDDPLLFADYRDMLKALRPDAVHVSTPHTLHFRHAYDSILAGAHVMIDKPMVTNATQARRLVKLAKTRKRALQIAVQGTHTDTFSYARQIIGDGTLGKTQLITGVLAQSWMKFCKGLWRQDPKLSGGGQLYDSCAHVITAMLYLINSPVKEVFCWTDNKTAPVDINAVATIKFANGAMGTITCGGNCAAWKSHVIVQGEKGMLEVSAHGGDFKVVSDHSKEPITGTPKGWKIPTVSPIRNFADVILGKAKPRCPGTLGIVMADLMDALYASAAKNRPVKVTRSVRV